MGVVRTTIGEVNFSDNGKGKAVVFLHGYLESIEIWSDFVETFYKKFRVVLVDLPGHGKSTVNNDSVSMDEMANAVNEVLNHLGISKVVLVGHSMGGYVTLAFANRFPEKVKGIVLFHSHPNPDPPQKLASRLSDIEKVSSGFLAKIVEASIPNLYANENVKRFEEYVARSKSIALKTSAKGVVAALSGMVNRDDRNDVIEKISSPVLIIFGRKDNLIPSDAAEKIVQKHPASRVCWLENSGHMGFIEERNQATAAIASFLTEAFDND
ncbi:MAG TPA: alpha/beta hydrolase [Tenuifilaceae bacterium]|nr:alpha/beta hydrolase [Tenuifilaceae bacterium]